MAQSANPFYNMAAPILNDMIPLPAAGSGQGVQQPPPPPYASTIAPVTGGPNVSTPSQGVYNTSANLYNQAAAGPNIGQFMNPYTNMVTGQALNNLERQRQMATNTMGAQAGQAGAFGGSRHGVAEGVTNTGFARQGAEMFGSLQSQGFNTALGAAQNQQGIQSNLAGQGFGFGQQIAQQQQQQGGQQQALMQALIEAAKAQYGGYTGAPMASLAAPMAALGAANMNQSTTKESQQPGLFNYLSLGLGLM